MRIIKRIKTPPKRKYKSQPNDDRGESTPGIGSNEILARIRANARRGKQIKCFREDLEKFEIKLRKNEPFALARFGDGEKKVLLDEHIDTAHRKKGNLTDKRWSGLEYVPGDPKYSKLREELVAAYQHQDPDYHVGVMCTCCANTNLQNHIAMKNLSGLPESNLTFAGIFSNGNFDYFINFVVPVFDQKNVILVCNEHADPSRLPFRPIDVFTVGSNAWVNNHDLVDKLSGLISARDMRGHVFLFCAGVFSKILVHRLFVEHKDMGNTYIDVGSPLDIFMNDMPSRRFMTDVNGSPRKRMCQWG